MDTLVKFCLIGLVVGAWFSEYVGKPLVRTLADKVHPMLLFTLLIGLCILLIQERTERNELFIAQNPHVVVTPWSVIP